MNALESFEQKLQQDLGAVVIGMRFPGVRPRIATSSTG